MRRHPSSKYVDVEAMEDSNETEESEYIGPSDESESYMQSEELVVNEPISAFREEDDDVAEERMSFVPLPHTKLFLVRVRSGKETQVCEKFAVKENFPPNFNKANNITPPISVFSKPELRGYVYVEALNKNTVIELVSKIRFTFKNVSLVPQREMSDVLSLVQNVLEKGKFARVRSGKYKNDVVQIIEPGSEIVRIRLVPRLEGSQCLFDPRKYGAVYMKGYAVYKRDVFKDGFLEKEMPAKNLCPTNDLSHDEMEIFGEKHSKIAVGDNVKITRDELRSMVGRVLQCNKQTVACLTPNGKFDVDAECVKRHFAIEDEVSVREKNGVVVATENDEVVVVIGFEKEVRVSVDEIGHPVAVEGTRTAIRKKRGHRVIRDPMLNKEVEIMIGEFKGYKGIVRDVTERECRVILNSNAREITIPVDKAKAIKVPVASGESYTAPIYGGRTPGYTTPGVNTPNYKTPNMRTPNYKTPNYKTPNMKTPNYKTPNMRTPNYKTPNINTPNTKTPTYRRDEPVDDVFDAINFSGAVLLINGREEVVREMRGDKFVCESGEYSRDNVDILSPVKYDKVCIIAGEARGKNGLLVDLNNEVGVVRIADGNVMSVPIKNITKLKYS